MRMLFLIPIVIMLAISSQNLTDLIKITKVQIKSKTRIFPIINNLIYIIKHIYLTRAINNPKIIPL